MTPCTANVLLADTHVASRFIAAECASQSATSYGLVPSARYAQLGTGPQDVTDVIPTRHSGTVCHVFNRQNMQSCANARVMGM